MRESFKSSQEHQNKDIPHTGERFFLSGEYSAQIPNILAKEKQFGHGLGAYGRRALTGFLLMTTLVIGEGAMRNAHGQVGQKSGSEVEDVFNKYSGAVENVSRRELGEVEKIGRQSHEAVDRVRGKADQEVDKYHQQRRITVDHPSGTHVEIRQGYGGKRSEAPPVSEQRYTESHYEQIDELAVRALRLLYDVSDRKQARHLIEEFAKHIKAGALTGGSIAGASVSREDIGEAAEILSANFPRLINRLNNKPDNTHDAGDYTRFTRSMKAHPGIQEVLDSAHFKTAPRPKGSLPR